MLIATLFSNSASATNAKVDIIDLTNHELVFVLNKSVSNSFTEYFVFQYESNNFSFLSQKSTFSLVGYTATSITIQCDNEQITFTSGFGTNSSTQYYGYGLSKRNGSYTLNMPLPATGNIFDVVIRPMSVSGAPTTNKITCHSGGPGSTSCSAEAGTLGGGGSCSVTCSTGYYACCDDTKNECKCVKIVSASGISGASSSEAILENATIVAYFSK